MAAGGNLVNRFAASGSFELHVAKADFKFNAAHFMLFSVCAARRQPAVAACIFGCLQEGRERMHGHNYSVSVSSHKAFQTTAWERLQLQVEIEGPLGADGYVIDFSVLKRAVRTTCKELDERTLIPLHCPSLEVIRLSAAPQLPAGEQLSASRPSPGAGSAGDCKPQPHIALTLPDASTFVLPESDCCLLPLSNVSVEELCVLLCVRVGQQLPLQELQSRGVHSIKVGVQETPNQKAVFKIQLEELAAGVHAQEQEAQGSA